MNKYRCTFQGRQVGAIGIMHHCRVEVEAETPDAARLKLYDTHEHISLLQVHPIPEGTVYAALQAAGIPLDSHESDLYAKVTPECTAILVAFDAHATATMFRCQKDQTLWYDIPFAYLPWWEERQPKGEGTQ